MHTPFHRSRFRPRGAAMLMVMALAIIGGIGVTAWVYLLAARAIQASRMGDSVARHITWNNTAAINQEYNFTYAYRDNVTQPELTATVTGGGGEVAAAYSGLNTFNSANTYSNPTTFAAPFNNVRKQITADNSVYYTRTTATSDVSQTEHLLYYNFQKTYPRTLLGDLLIVYAKPSGAANTYITDNLKVNGRVLIYDSTADTAGVAANECLNLTKTGTNTTIDNSATATLLPQNFPSIPVFTAGTAGAGTGAVLNGGLNVLNNSNFTVNSLRHKLEASSLGYYNLSTADTSGNNIESDDDSGGSSSAVWVDQQSSGSFTYNPPGTSPYSYSPGSTLNTVTLLLKHSSLKHIRIISGVEQLILKGQTNSTDYNTAGTLAPLIILVEQEIRDIRLVGENNRPIILGTGTGTGQVLYMAWSGSNVTGSGALRWRLHIVNQYRQLYLEAPSSNNVTLTGSIRTNWGVYSTDGSANDRFFLNTESNPGALATLLPRDGWFEPLIVQ